jgi:hypothetical protein
LRAPALASHQKAAGLHHTKKLQDNCREQWKGKEKLTPRTDSIDGHSSKSLQTERQNASIFDHVVHISKPLVSSLHFGPSSVVCVPLNIKVAWDVLSFSFHFLNPPTRFDFDPSFHVF